MSDDTQHLLETAIEAAKKAGAYLLEHRGSLTSRDITEKQKNDFVTTVDKTSEKMIIEHLLSTFPDHSVLTEESGIQHRSGSVEWIVDPLDGTTNFIHNLPAFSLSIAARQDDDIIVGVIYNPVEEELFTARRGGGAFLNGRRIKVSQQIDFNRALLGTGFPHHSKYYLPQYLLSLGEIFYQSAGIRRMGSAAIDLCYTACGRYDGFWEAGLHIWDIAAGSLLIREAGGVVSDFNGKSDFLQNGFIIAGNKEIHRYLTRILSYHFKGAEDE